MTVKRMESVREYVQVFKRKSDKVMSESLVQTMVDDWNAEEVNAFNPITREDMLEQLGIIEDNIIPDTMEVINATKHRL